MHVLTLKCRRMGAMTVNCRWNLVVNYRCGGSKNVSYFLFFGFVFCFFFVLIHYAIDVYVLVSCLFIVMCCLFIVVVENANDNLGETKQFLSRISEMSNRLRLKPNQILMELPFMLELHYMLTVSSHLIPTKLTHFIFFQRR